VSRESIGFALGALCSLSLSALGGWYLIARTREQERVSRALETQLGNALLDLRTYQALEELTAPGIELEEGEEKEDQEEGEDQWE
jgi:hypothetical protein